MTHPTFQDLGLPPDCRVFQVIANEATRTLVAHVALNHEPHPRGRLYARAFDGDKYLELVPHRDGLDIEVPLSCPRSPFVYFNRRVWNDVGGNWDGLYRAHCSSRVLDRVPFAGAGSAWISEVIGISGDGTYLLVVAAANSPGCSSRSADEKQSEIDRLARMG